VQISVPFECWLITREQEGRVTPEWQTPS
jgi:hypothetical protein